MAEILDEDAAACRSGAVLSRLAAAGIQAGDRIAVLAANGPGFVAARDAATAADVVLVPINPRLAAAEVAWIVGHARPRALLVDEAHRAAAPGQVPVIELDALAGGTAAPLDHARVGATLLYTSGTTGRPKGCWRTADQERARSDELRASYGLAASDTHLIVCPLGHSAPGIFLRAARAAGARTVIASRFTAESFVADAQHHRATVVFLVPTQVHRLLAIDPPPRLDSLRAVIVAGAPFPPAQKAAFDAWLGHGRLYEFYGSSETGTVSVIGPDEHAAHPGSVGRPPPGVSVQLHDGEIFVRSPTVMSGYLDETGEHVAPLAHRDGHISVGDLGTIDEGGWITLVDRKHDTIITGGLNVYPAEVERALAALPEVAGAVVFGVPDADWGQLVAAVIATRDGEQLDGQYVRHALRAQLAGYKLPRALVTCSLDELPIGSSGKALRRAAREAFASRLQRVDGAS
ncbi:MAG TPA: class I adenylate-forming enzyme family protein [Kofleriaceae bacterium]|nr:class I adenylate-forming enzyme family protein [Kofleriaceae bacterium]